MQYKRFNDMNISALGLGVMRLPEVEGKPGVIDRMKGRAIIDRAISGGINYFDTAHIYQSGDSERFIGETLSDYPRDSYYLATKFKVTNAKDIKDMFAQQLKRCNTDYFDVYLLHNITAGTFDEYTDPANGYLDFLLEQQKEGRIRYLGFSSHGTPEIIQKTLDWHRFDMAQIQVNYLDWDLIGASAQYKVLEDNGIPTWIMEPVKGGKLANLNKEASDILKAAAPNQSVASWAFRYLFDLPAVQTILSGMSTIEQLEDNLSTFADPARLTEEEKQILAEAARAFMKEAGVLCSSCRYCVPACPMELDIPLLIKGYNVLNTSGSTWRAEGFDKARGADNCIGCGACAALCPQNINIPDVMQKLAAALAK